MKTCIVDDNGLDTVFRSYEFDDKEIDIIAHALLLLKRDLKFDLETFVRYSDLDSVSHCVDALSLIEFILPKIKL